MKKLLIALAAIGSVNAFAASVNVELHNNTACPVSVNGTSYNPGETGHAVLNSDGTYAVTEYSSFDDGSYHCQVAAATVLVSFAGNQPSDKDGDSFFLSAIQGNSFSNISSPFGGLLQVDGQSQSLGNGQEAKIRLSANQTHNAVLTVNGSGVIPAGQKPQPVTPDHVYPSTIQATITNNTSCPMVIMGGPTIQAGDTARNITLNATSAILEKMDGPTGKCALSTTAEIYYDHATVTPASNGKVELKQNILENNGSYFNVSAVSGNQSGATTSKAAGTFLNHAFNGEVEKNNPAVNITVSTHVNPAPTPQAGVYPEGYPNYKAGDRIRGTDGKTYECKPFPYTGWCNQAPTVYAPGTGSSWADAWAGVSFNAGTYTSTDASNLALQTRFGDTESTLNAQSVRFDYNYNTANGGPGWVSADCMENTGLANYESSPAACTNGSPCGFDQLIQQDALLPESFQRAIFITNTTTTGNMGGLAGADAICNNDVNKPKRGAASLYKALLAGNNSTTVGVDYYRSDYLTKIATATGNDLVAFGNASALLNSVNAGESHSVWTGFTPAMTADGNGWFYYDNDTLHNNCLAWQNADSASYGITGTDNVTESQTQNTTPYWNTGWAISNDMACNTSLPIMCVQQSESVPSVSGTLAITVSTGFIHIGESVNAVVSLNNSSGVTSPITVNIDSNEPGVMGTTPASCSLTTAAPNCTVKLTGLATGTATFSASTADYQTATSDTLVIRYPLAYVTNYYGINNQNSGPWDYIQCNIGPNGLESQTCVSVIPTAPGALNGPTQQVIYQGFIYFTNDNSTSYTQCKVNAYGIESATCNTVGGILTYPLGAAAAGQYVYFTNWGGNSYTQCHLNSNGIESNTCNTIQLPGPQALNQPGGMAITGNLIYFPNLGDSSYTSCTLGANGIESATCSKTVLGSSLLTIPYSIAFAGDFAYIPNWALTNSSSNDGTSYAQCNVVNNVIESNTCTKVIPPAPGQLSGPNGVTIYNNKAYFMNQNDGKYTQCNIGINGLIDSNTCNTKQMQLLHVPQFMVVY